MSLWITIVFIILVIWIVVAGTLLSSYYYKSQECFNNPSFWCYSDWKCNDPDRQNPVDSVSKIFKPDMCGPGTSAPGKNCTCPWDKTAYDPSAYNLKNTCVNQPTG